MRNDPPGDAPLLALDAIGHGDTTGWVATVLHVIAVLSPHGVGVYLLHRLAPPDSEANGAAIERCVRGSVLSRARRRGGGDHAPACRTRHRGPDFGRYRESLWRNVTQWIGR
ncbi:hypothetical protein ACFQZZ_01995 [Nocardia sp. GCM10030253]|uniref:hypothetical protein n=1 Tax=Nocardia sp. GCM10030253 TaxID=3273404 RepID=UPI003636F605